jgi:hypothetical protein|tara:strand:- start:255 stop:371 length:117 start_codon:yes stop_codon:yes gene_type:complete
MEEEGVSVKTEKLMTKNVVLGRCMHKALGKYNKIGSKK